MGAEAERLPIMLTPPEWTALIANAMDKVAAPIRALVPIGRMKWGATMPAMIRCSDGEMYIVKGAQVGRSLVTEQIVGRLGAMIEAPVARVELVDVSRELIGDDEAIDQRGTNWVGHFLPGIAHGSAFIANCTDDWELAYQHQGDNPTRLARLAVLYGWVKGDDYQFLYEADPPRLVYAFDHGECFPRGSDWSIDSLEAAPDPFFAADVWVPAQIIHREIARLREVTDADIARTVAIPPTSWGLTMDERVALARYLSRRRDQLLRLVGVPGN